MARQKTRITKVKNSKINECNKLDFVDYSNSFNVPCLGLSGYFLDQRRQEEVFEFSECKLAASRGHPGSKVSHLAVISIISHEHFGTNSNNFTVQYPHTAVVRSALVSHWHANVTKYVFSHTTTQNFREACPRVIKCVVFKETVLTPVTCYLQFRPMQSLKQIALHQ